MAREQARPSGDPVAGRRAARCRCSRGPQGPTRRQGLPQLRRSWWHAAGSAHLSKASLKLLQQRAEGVRRRSCKVVGKPLALGEERPAPAQDLRLRHGFQQGHHGLHEMLGNLHHHGAVVHETLSPRVRVLHRWTAWLPPAATTVEHDHRDAAAEDREEVSCRVGQVPGWDRAERCRPHLLNRLTLRQPRHAHVVIHGNQ
mmetsp:Transcript_118749/g.288270  ORF Transcript_118749/g.288270 Transcript_118749/m.288270 type:complete len:200 (-) Transcript_118749:203-802(-)